MTATSWSVILGIFSLEVPPEIFTHIVGLEPDFCANAGSMSGRSTLPRRFNQWELRSHRLPTHDITEHLDDLLGRSEARAGELAEAGHVGGGLELSIVGRYSDMNSSIGINLSSDHIKLIGILGASVDIECYYLPGMMSDLIEPLGNDDNTQSQGNEL
ncbi:MAG: DUF4279 domain-containing protein [Acidimicrobiales bacterium]